MKDSFNFVQTNIYNLLHLLRVTVYKNKMKNDSLALKVYTEIQNKS